MFPSAHKTNGKRKSRAPRQLSVKVTDSSQNSPQSQCRHRRKACTQAGAVCEQQLGMLAGVTGVCWAMLVPSAKTKQRPLLMAQVLWWNPSTWQQQLSCISILIAGSDPGWSRSKHGGVLQEWPRLPIPVPRQGPDGPGLPQLQSEVPLWQIWYVPHHWKTTENSRNPVLPWLAPSGCLNNFCNFSKLNLCLGYRHKLRYNSTRFISGIISEH